MSLKNPAELFTSVMEQARAAGDTVAPAAATAAASAPDKKAAVSASTPASAAAKPPVKVTVAKPAAATSAVARRRPTVGRVVFFALVAIGVWTLLQGPAVALKDRIEQAYAPQVSLTYVNVATPGASR